jgi:o-succinylbenzoate---CoA ligase
LENTILKALFLHIGAQRLIIGNTEEVEQYKNDLCSIDEDIYYFLKAWFGRDESISMPTSGSTGVAKQILHSKEAMRASARATLTYFGLKKGDSALLCLPVKYVAGKMMLVRAIVGGLELYAEVPAVNPLSDFFVPVKFAAMTPHQVQYIVKESPDKLKLVEILIIGGGEVNTELIESLNASTITTHCYSTFGMTETITHIAVRRLNPLSPGFTILPGITIAKSDKGALSIKVPYIGDYFIHTNDAINLIDEDTFSWLGRIDHVINSGGIKLFPETIEQKIAELIPNVVYYITSEADEILGERVVLVIESAEDIELPNLSMVVSSYELPKKVYFQKELPRTPTGKIIRQKL